MAEWCFINGELLPENEGRLHFRDLSIQRGYGIFDFLKVVNGVPVFLHEHLDRFYSSAAAMRLKVQYSRQQLVSVIHELLQKNGTGNCGVRLTLTGGYSNDGYQLSHPNLVVSLHSFLSPTIDQFEKGIRLMGYEHQRQLPAVKSIDYLMAIWLEPVVRGHNADEVLYHERGMISECPRSNIFIVTNEEKVVTPARNILNGITRSKIIGICKDVYQLEERDITIDELKKAKEVFISSTTKMILPVCQIDEHRFSAGRTIATHLQHQLQQLVAQYKQREE